jgi:hypothetical protein
MHGNQLIFSRSGDRRRLYTVDPLLFSEYGVLSNLFLPNPQELPAHGLTAQVVVFDFGFNDPTLTVAPLDTQFFPFSLSNNYLAISICGVSDVPPSQGVVPAAGVVNGVQQTPAFLVNIQHTHNGSTFQWCNKDVTDRELCGRNGNALMLRHPAFVPAGDTLSCVVRNLSNTSLRVQVMLNGGAF